MGGAGRHKGSERWRSGEQCELSWRRKPTYRQLLAHQQFGRSGRCQRDCVAFYGNPTKSGFLHANTVDVECPWPLHVEGTISHKILIHKKCAAALTHALTSIWDAVGHDTNKIHELRYDIFDGSYAPRNKRGGSTWSMHYFAVAMDWDAKDNAFHAMRHLFKDDNLIVVKFKEVGAIWGGDWSPGSVDAMHFQFARIHS